MKMNEILKKRIEEAANDRYTDNTFAYKGFIDGAEYALSHQWISVEDVLPKYDESVIVAFGDDDYALLHRSNNSNVLTDKNGFCNYSHKQVIAWMPIPKFEMKK